MNAKFPASLLLIVFALLVGCGGDSDVCTDDSKCFQGEVCYLGECIDEENVPVDANVSSNSSTNNGSANSSTNNGGTNGSTNSSSNGAPNNEMFCGFDNCEVDPFICECGDDGNDSFAEAIQTENVGCTRDSFTSMNKTIRARMCALEPVDKFSQSFIECDTQTFRLKVTMDPVVEVCDNSHMNMNLSVQGKSCENQSESSDITCSWNEQGQFVAQALVRPGRSVNGFYISVDSGEREDIDFVYDLTVEVSE